MSNLSFIEQQFPVSKVSKESYKERKAVAGQTLTGLGKWWGRKPLILVRASIIGMLMPVSDDPKKDRDIFLKILTMDDDGLVERKSKNIVVNKIYENISERDKEEYFVLNSKGKPQYKNGVSNTIKKQHQKIVFNKLNYDEKLDYCFRPEHISGPSDKSWSEINSHLGTSATSIQQLVEQLGKKKFGHIPRIGDSFAGGGSIPFEASRIGCESYGSDLNPVAALLTQMGIHLLNGGEKLQQYVKDNQREAYMKADSQMKEWGVENNEKGWRADSYLYCIEAIHPSSGYRVPLIPSLTISDKHQVIAVLKPDHDSKKFKIEIVENVDNDTYKSAKIGTVRKGRVFDLITGDDVSISSIRGDKRDSNGNNIYGLRQWEHDDIIPRIDDILTERLYCIRYVDEDGKRHYVEPSEQDIKREETVLTLVKDRIDEWKKKGYIPSNKIEDGSETTRLKRERGWTYWCHLYNPRQLLFKGLISEFLDLSEPTNILLLGKYANWDSRLCRWITAQGGGIGGGTEIFYNQAFNTFYNYSCRATLTLKSLYANLNIVVPKIETNSKVEVSDARQIDINNDIWITDPPYADAINYHELVDLYLSWYEKHLPKTFPHWYTDNKKVLAVKGSGIDFKHSMVDIYTNLTKHMPDNGLQMVQFTHQDPSVWADLAMILWASGLRVTAAWTIATETSTGLKTGNYVQGTVLLILRKRLEKQTAFISEIYAEIEDEVKEQLDQMTTLDDKEDPNFADTDYQLAAYAAALRVLTWYDIDGYDVEHELFREKEKGEKNKFEEMIDKAVEIATNHLIPDGIDKMYWRDLGAQERLYFKGLELEKHGEMRSGAYQELARGFGVRDYQSLQAGNSANAIRFKTPSEFKKSNLNSGDFGDTTLRQLLFSVYEATRTEELSEGLNYLRAEVPNYWNKRKLLIAMLDYVIRFDSIEHMSHWQNDVASAKLLAGAIQNDTPGA